MREALRRLDRWAVSLPGLVTMASFAALVSLVVTAAGDAQERVRLLSAVTAASASVFFGLLKRRRWRRRGQRPPAR